MCSTSIKTINNFADDCTFSKLEECSNEFNSSEAVAAQCEIQNDMVTNLLCKAENLPPSCKFVDNTVYQSSQDSNTKKLEEVALNVLDQQVNFPDASLDKLVDDMTTEGVPGSFNQKATPGEYFVTSSYEEMMTIIEDYFDRTSSRFVVQKRTKDFGVKGANFNLYKHRIQWEDTKNPNISYEYNFLPFDGVPHITVGHYVMHCQFGRDASAAQKRKRREQKNAGKISTKTRVLKYPTKKCGCPAKIYVKQVIKFPEYRIDKKTERRKRTGATKLKENFLVDRHSILLDVYFMGRLPMLGEHKYHELMEGREFSKECVHKDLIIKTQELHMQNYALTDIMESLDSYIVNEMFYNQEPPSKNRRKYYPSRKDLRNFIGRIRQLSRISKEEKKKISDFAKTICTDVANCGVLFTFTEDESIQNIDIGSSDDEAETNADINSDENAETSKPQLKEKVQTFLSCYQTPEQQRLLKRYGNTVTLIVEVLHNATVKRALTFKMFLLVVQTNVDYQTVGCIVFSKQRANGLEHGLSLLKERNEFWMPKYMLIDCTDEIKSAVDQLFPNADCFLNIKSCERLWSDFIRTPSNGVHQHCQEILNYLKNMGHSYSEQFLSQSASHLEESDVWQKSEKLREWFQSDWLPIAKKWVVGYRPDDFLMFGHLKFSLDTCVNVYEELISNSTRFLYGIAGMFETLHNIVAKDEYKRYVERNIHAVQVAGDLKLDEMLVDSLDAVNSFMRPVVYDTCKEAAISNFNVTNTHQLGVFSVRMPPVKNITNILPPSSIDRTNLGAVEMLQNEMTVDELIRGIKGVDENVIQVFNFSDTISSSTSHVTSEGSIHDSSVVTAAGILANAGLNDIENVVSEEDIEAIGNCQDVVTTSSNTIEDFTVSFGDANCQPFCSCSYWKQFKLPCVHMFYIFQKVPGWKYDMLSPIYRMNNVFHKDCACVSSLLTPLSTSDQSQTSTEKKRSNKVAAQTQKNLGDYGIFLPINDLNSSEKLFRQLNDLLQQINNLRHVFQDLVYFKNFRQQLIQLTTAIQDKIVQENAGGALSGDKLVSDYLSSLIQNSASNQESNDVQGKIQTDFVIAETNNEETEEIATTYDHVVHDANNSAMRHEAASAETSESMIMIPRTSLPSQICNANETIVQINQLASVPILLEKNFAGKETSNCLDGVVITGPVRAQDIIVSSAMSMTGIKRDIRNDEDDRVFKKMSILEYLPLLKKKCVDKPTEQKLEESNVGVESQPDRNDKVDSFLANTQNT